MMYYFYASKKEMQNIFDEEEAEFKLRPRVGKHGTGVYFVSAGPDANPGPLLKAIHVEEGEPFVRGTQVEKMTEYLAFEKAALPKLTRAKKGIFIFKEPISLKDVKYTRGVADEIVAG